MAREATTRDWVDVAECTLAALCITAATVDTAGTGAMADLVHDASRVCAVGMAVSVAAVERSRLRSALACFGPSTSAKAGVAGFLSGLAILAWALPNGRQAYEAEAVTLIAVGSWMAASHRRAGRIGGTGDEG